MVRVYLRHSHVVHLCIVLTDVPVLPGMKVAAVTVHFSKSSLDLEIGEHSDLNISFR